ncbi:MAG: hypothetical protein AOA65_0545 [Candidatus Bathyarchaeota archaeon BA1]|nr:MAG: hypothetical protein AOA65_0545 [Candidatus Bathyarchaeota archaeon BA1]
MRYIINMLRSNVNRLVKISVIGEVAPFLADRPTEFRLMEIL